MVIKRKRCIGRYNLGIESIPGHNFLLRNQIVIRSIVSGFSLLFKIWDQNSRLDEALIPNHSQGGAKPRSSLMSCLPFSNLICKTVLPTQKYHKQQQKQQQQQQKHHKNNNNNNNYTQQWALPFLFRKVMFLFILQ